MVVEKMKIQWEDDDTSLTENEEMSVFDEQPQVEEDFAELLASSEAGETESPETSWRVGDKIQAKIAYANPDSPDVLLECGLKDSAVMPRDELLTEAGEFPYEPGDLIEAYVVTAKEGELVLSRNMSQAASGAQAIETAYASKMPVRGKVLKVNKGGFEVRVLSKSAFCPISQMDLSFVKDPALYVGQDLEFLIQQYHPRNIVLSRAALLRRKATEAVPALRERIQKEPVVEGKVTELRDFGAMVEVQGLSGMLHISELSYSRVKHPSEVLRVGETIRVKVLSVGEQNSPDELPRIALSLKQAIQDPWTTASTDFIPGESQRGVVTRLAAFGAFVELKPGVEGLIHLSEMSWLKRVLKPSGSGAGGRPSGLPYS